MRLKKGILALNISSSCQPNGVYWPARAGDFFYDSIGP